MNRPALHVQFTSILGWADQAACHDHPDPDLWTGPLRRGAAADQRTTTAKQICDSCPVREECLDAAMSVGRDRDFGIWGGLTEKERETLRRRRLRRRRA